MKSCKQIVVLILTAVMISCAVYAQNIDDPQIRKGEYSSVTVDGESAWEFPSMESSLYMDVSDGIVNRNTDGRIAEVEVSYYDDFDGYFTVMYDINNSYYPCATEEYVICGGTKQKKTKIFRIYDGYFGNNLDNNTDFCIAYYGWKGGTPLKVFGTRFTLSDKVNPINVSMSTGTAGNIFFDGDDKVVEVLMTNKTANKLVLNAVFEVLANDGTNSLCTVEKQCVIEEKSMEKIPLTIGSDRYGVFNLKVRVSDSEGKYEGEWKFPFAQAALNKIASNHIGINAGLMGENRDYTKAITLSRKAGIGIIRNGYSQEDMAKANGEPQRSKNIRSEAACKGMAILQTFDGNNTLKFSDIKDNTLPTNEEQRAAFAQYVYDTLKNYGGKIEHVEIWNEPDIKCEGGFSARDPQKYALLLKAVYQKVKPDFPDVKICGVCGHDILAFYMKEWTIKVLEASTGESEKGYQWLDAISVHHYLTRTEQYKEQGVRLDTLLCNNLGILDDWMAKNGVKKEIIHTEIGVNGKITEYTDESHADVLSQYLLTLHAYRPGEKFFIYDLANDSDSKIDGEGSFGLTQAAWYRVPYAAKPAFTAVSYMNSLLGSYTSAEVAEQSDAVTVYKFTNASGKKIYALYSQNDERDYTFNPPEDVGFFDRDGNVIEFTKNEGGYRLEIGASPIYAVEGKSDVRADNKPMLFAEPEFLFSEGDGLINIEGYFPNAEYGEIVAVKVFDGNGKIIQLGQFKIDRDKKCRFVIMGNETQNYKVDIAVKNVSYTGSVYKEGNGKVNVSVRTEDGQPVTSRKAWSNGIKLSVSPKEENENFTIVCAAFKDEKLKTVKSLKNSEMTKEGNMYIAELNVKEFENANNIKLFAFNSLNEVIPLIGKVEYK